MLLLIITIFESIKFIYFFIFFLYRNIMFSHLNRTNGFSIDVKWIRSANKKKERKKIRKTNMIQKYYDVMHRKKQVL